MFENLKKLRKELGLTQAQFAEKLGIPQTTYAGYEKGNSDPPAWFWLAVADRYRVSIDYLIGHTDDPQRTKYAARSKVEADYCGLDVDILTSGNDTVTPYGSVIGRKPPLVRQ